MKVVDLHCDTIHEIWLSQIKGDAPACLKRNSFHIDAEKLKKGDYALQTFAVYVNLNDDKDPLESCLEKIDVFFRELKLNSDLFAFVRTYTDIEKNLAQEKISALLSVEEGGVCKGSLIHLRNFYRLGVRMMTFTWNYENELGYPNAISDASSYSFTGCPDRRGLKEKGIEFLEEMEKLGMVVDVSHLSDGGFYDVVKHAKKPFIASHSNARSVSGHLRNLTDDMVKLLAEKGGLTGINFNAPFLDSLPDENMCQSSIELMVRHIKHLVGVGGIESIGIGTDYDGISLNLHLPDCSQIQRLANELIKAGFSEGQVEKIFYKNSLRVLKEIL